MSLALAGLVLVVGASASVVAWRQERDAAMREERASVQQARDLLGGVGNQIEASLAGSAGLVRPDGELNRSAFERFATELAAASDLSVLAFEPVVPAAGRAAFEERIGRDIIDRGEEGPRPAPDRAVHWPVELMAPVTPEREALIGFDLQGDPVRRDAALLARETGAVVLSEPVPSEPSGSPSFFVVKALFGPPPAGATGPGTHVGFLSTVFPGTRLADILEANLPPGDRFLVRDGDAVLTTGDERPQDGQAAALDVGGRRWLVVVDGGGEADHRVAWLLGLVTLLLVGGLVVFFRRSEEHRRVLDESAARAALLAEVTAREARSAQELARLAQELASRTSSEDVTSFLTRAVLAPLGADHAAVAVIDGAVLRRHFTPGPVTDLLQELLPDTVPLDDDSPLAAAARTGEAVLLPDEAALRAGYPHLADGWIGLGFQATANLPLRDREGALIGALGIAWNHAVDTDELTDLLATVAGIAGQTLDRARLVDRVTAQARRSSAMAELAEVLATARSADEVAVAITRHAAAVVDATRANLALVADGGELLVHHGDQVTDEVRARFSRVPADAPVPHVDAIREHRLLTFASRADFGQRYPDLVGVVEQAGGEAIAVAPLRDSAGRDTGAVGFVWTDPIPSADLPLVELRSIADLCAQALERAMLADAEHRLALTLQANVLQPLPAGVGLTGAARYLPAAETVGIGGDWYDGVQRGDRYLVVVGDVAGHGVNAVAQMAQLRSSLGTLARLDVPLEAILPQVSTAGRRGEQAVATAAVVEIDPVAGRLRYACAGHPPPLVRLPDGEVVVLDGGRQPVIGMAMAPSPPGVADFPTGSALLCYTDGLIERRDESIDASIGRLAAFLGEVGTADVDEVADAVLTRWRDQESQVDDVALVVIANVTPT